MATTTAPHHQDQGQGPSSKDPALLLCEATTREERAACFNLGRGVTSSEIGNAVGELQEHLYGRFLAGTNNRTRVWYLCLDTPVTPPGSSDATQSVPMVLAACKTVQRDLLICDDGVPSRQIGHKLTPVVTNPIYARDGGGALLALLLLEKVLAWLDSDDEDEGEKVGGFATLLYAPPARLYTDHDFKPVPCPQATLWTASREWGATSSSASSMSGAGLPSSRHLTIPSTSTSAQPSPPLSSEPSDDEISGLAGQDITECLAIADMIAPFLKGSRHLAVLPTATTTGAWFAQEDFLNKTITAPADDQGGERRRRRIVNRGAISNALSDVFVLWYHDTRRSQLTIQRLHLPSLMDTRLPPSSMIEGRLQPHAPEWRAQVRALAKLLLDALDEALAWGLAKVVLWTPCVRTREALGLLMKEEGVKVEVDDTGGGGEGAMMVRWKGDGNGERGRKEMGDVVFQMNEYYAWSG